MLCKILPRFKVFIFVEMIFDAKNKYTCNDILSHAEICFAERDNSVVNFDCVRTYFCSLSIVYFQT